VNIPKTPVGVLVVVGILLFVMFAVYTTTWPALAIATLFIVIMLAAVYYIGYRADKVLKNGL